MFVHQFHPILGVAENGRKTSPWPFCWENDEEQSVGIGGIYVQIRPCGFTRACVSAVVFFGYFKCAVECWHWMLTPFLLDLRCFGQGWTQHKTTKQHSTPKWSKKCKKRYDRKEKNNAKPVAPGICLNRPTIPHLSVRESRYLDAFYICYLWS